MFTGEQAGTLQQPAPNTASPRYRSPKQQVMFRPRLWAALQVEHIDLKERGSSGMQEATRSCF